MVLLSLFAVVGVVFTLVQLVRLWSFSYIHFLRPGKDLRKLGSWAVVTGASDGIGKGYSQNLARKGLNVVLISRTESKLLQLASEIEEQYNVKTKIIVADFAKDDRSQYEMIQSGIEGLDVGVLVNNVGVSYDFPQFFHEVPAEKLRAMVNVNINATNEMTRIVLPGMVNRRRGAIINLSSGYGVFPSPMLAVYSATKAYIDFFSQSLSAEYKQFGIQVQSVVPFFVTTNMSKIRTPTLTVPSAQHFTKLAVEHIGHDDLRVSPYYMHSLQMWKMSSLLPRFMSLASLQKNNASIRERALAAIARRKARSLSSQSSSSSETSSDSRSGSTVSTSPQIDTASSITKDASNVTAAVAAPCGCYVLSPTAVRKA
eukprot:GEZU01018421.1.p1 GENE.GEZU01018421.1~~GEZU01018421.1.p1  ORF type:complete len:371 (-),score=84.75 GEZU01018421.1:225-1337(-)